MEQVVPQWPRPRPAVLAQLHFWGYHLQNNSGWLASGPRMADLQRCQQQVCVLLLRTLLTSE